TGTVRKQRHNKVLKRTRGMRMTKGRLFKVSNEADLHAGQYAFIGRKLRKRDLRRLWIKRLSTAVSSRGMSYSVFISRLGKNKVELNRKMLSEIAFNDPATFDQIFNQIK
ncbi:50S ribosomal protein L20, partial [Patescibacteria group bacterium]|nr:50S ribosomal protein L20 [Patescibacteria group bacterium]